MLRILSVVLFIPLNSARAGTGQEIYVERQCHICHGETGTEKIQGMPRLFGQQKQYLTNQMNDILSGKRNNNYSHLMRMNYSTTDSVPGSLQKQLSKQDITALVEFLNALKRK